MQMISMKNIHFSFDCVEMAMGRTLNAAANRANRTQPFHYRSQLRQWEFLLVLFRSLLLHGGMIKMCACSGPSKPDIPDMLIRRNIKNHMNDRTKIDWLTKSILKIILGRKQDYKNSSSFRREPKIQIALMRSIFSAEFVAARLG